MNGLRFCGTLRGWGDHVRIAERPCRLCRIAKRSFEAGRRAERQDLGLPLTRVPYDYPGGRDEYLIATYGINSTEYAAILEAQGGGCAICGSQRANRIGSLLVVDHDHDHCPLAETCRGCIRGLLCSPCNIREEAAGEAWTEYLDRRWAQSVLAPEAVSA